MSTDFYAVLGIVPTASEDVIKAVYRALAKKHHPDAGGDANRFREITEAYATLSDPAKRRHYDHSHDSFYAPETDIGDFDEDLQREWDKAIKHSPEIDLLYWELKRYSNSLALNFRLNLLKQKTYWNAVAIFNDLEKLYFETYFGTSDKIHKFVKFLLMEGRRDAAKELNRAVKKHGDALNEDAIIQAICREHNLLYFKMNQNTHQEEKF